MRLLATLSTVVAILAAGCTSTAPTTPPATPTSSSTASPTATTPASTSTSTGDLGDVPGIVADVGPSVVSIRFAQGEGSGVIYSSDGYVVTNDHVVEAAAGGAMEVALANGEQLAASAVATDPVTDLAVVQVDVTGLPAASFSTRLPEVGELAVALGNPLGFQNSATAGIISGLDRTLPAQSGQAPLVGLIQTDAPISPGNSGGALVDVNDRVVGINVAKIPSQLNASNVGFAIPATTVVPVVDQLISQGTVHHPYLGIRGGSLTPQIAREFGIDRESGVVVADVTAGGPADRAGLQPGDVIVGLAGTEVASFGDLVSAIRDHAPGDTVAVTIVRDGQEQTLQITLGELPQ